MKTHDTMGISLILRSAKEGDKFLTTASDRELQGYAIREQCGITTHRLQMIDDNRIFPLLLVTVTHQVPDNRRAVFSRRPHIRRKNRRKKSK